MPKSTPPKCEYEVRGNYGYGWEMVTTEATRELAEVRLAEYLENDNHPHKIVRVRILPQATKES
jgi:hypothetical protein